MNTRNLQIHLENKLSSLASACMDNNAVDDGLIYEILANDEMSDETRLNYICQIEVRLPSNCKSKRKTETDLNSLYQEPEEVRSQKQERWNKLHQIAVELKTNHENKEVPRERFYQLVSILIVDSKPAGTVSNHSKHERD